MYKSSEGYLWVVCEEPEGVRQRVLYVKVFGHLPTEPIKVSLEIQDRSDGRILQLHSIEAISGLATSEEVLESGNYLKVDEKELVKMNGGDKRMDDREDDLKNLVMKVTFGS
jgi:hypothetical protein